MAASRQRPDLEALLRLLAEQNAAMLAAHAGSLRLQELLIERLLGSESGEEQGHAEEPAPAPVQIEEEPLPEEDQPPDEPEAPGAATPVRKPQEGTGPHGQRSLTLLKRLADAELGEKLVLLFGPYRGQTLRGVASIDPEYVRTLARSGRSPEVRAAAGRLARVLPLRSSRGLSSGAWPTGGASASHGGGAWG